MSSPWLLAILVVVANGCAAPGAPGRPSPEPANQALSLVLTAEPASGEAPLAVRFAAELRGDPADPARFACPTVAWVLGNGEVTISRPTDCQEGVVSRRFTLTGVYRSAGSFDAYLRLVAVDLEASNVVQVLVRGPTPTPAPRQAMAGPTIIIATAPSRPGGTATPLGPESTAVALVNQNPPLPSATLIIAAGAGTPAGAVAPTSPPLAGQSTAVAALPAPTAAGTRLALGAPSPLAGAAATVAAIQTAAQARAEEVAGGSAPGAATEPSVMTAPSASARLFASATPQAAFATATPEAMAGPATLAPAVPAVPATAPGAFVAPPTRPRPIQAPAPTSRPAPPRRSAQVLPADLYYLAGSPRRLWRLSSSGDPPVAQSPPGVEVTDYAVALHGRLAYVTDAGLQVVLDARTASLGTTIEGASAPVWSPDGRRLAYRSAEAVWTYDVGGGSSARLATAERPLAWSPGGTWLALSDLDGAVSVQNLASGRRQRLPLGAFDSAGWLPDREVLWLAGDGAMLVSFERTIQAQPLWPPGVRVAAVEMRADLHLLAMIAIERGWAPYEVDLNAPVLRPRLLGGPIAIDADGLATTDSAALNGAFAWSPDGHNGALADRQGLALVDPATGAGVPLVREAARRPRWALP